MGLIDKICKLVDDFIPGKFGVTSKTSYDENGVMVVDVQVVSTYMHNATCQINEDFIFGASGSDYREALQNLYKEAKVWREVKLEKENKNISVNNVMDVLDDVQQRMAADGANPRSLIKEILEANPNLNAAQVIAEAESRLLQKYLLA